MPNCTMVKLQKGGETGYVMWPKTGRKNKNTTRTSTPVPAEVQDYYEAGRRERRGVAWLLGLITLVVTVLLALLLFFGGRWIYRKATNKDKSTSGQTTNQPASSGNDSAGDSGSSTNANSSSNSNPTSNPSTTPSGSSNTSSTPSDTNSSAPLPRTGPDIDL